MARDMADRSRSGVSRLAELFRPPFEMLHRGSIESGLKKAIQDDKWFLLNVQDPAIFDCQILNRDHWKDEQIKDMIRTSFIFMQVSQNELSGSVLGKQIKSAKGTDPSLPWIATIYPDGMSIAESYSAPIGDVSTLRQKLDRFLSKNGVWRGSCSECLSELRCRDSRENGNSPVRLIVSSLEVSRSSCGGCRVLYDAIHKFERDLKPETVSSMDIWLLNRNRRSTRCNINTRSGRNYPVLAGWRVSQGRSVKYDPQLHCNNWGMPALGSLSDSTSRFPVQATKEWLARCAKDHKLCTRPTVSSLPRRVIDVAHREAYLYETKGGEVAPYATLSHCWATSVPVQTTRASLRHHYRRLVWNDLPTAFQEAIEFTRSLDIRYLWIDSLCILQDDDEEWEIESGRMVNSLLHFHLPIFQLNEQANIFENSAVTIALHQSDVDESCFNPCIASVILPFYTASIQFDLKHPYPAEHNRVLQTRLASRGWCFQERQLAARVVHCLPNGVAFECAVDEGCRCESAEPHSHFSDKLKESFAQENITGEQWRNMIVEYRRTNFTYSSDVLPALSGITNRVRGLGKYYGGMWETTLDHDLLWLPIVSGSGVRQTIPTRASTEQTPSFLWASIQSPILFINMRSMLIQKRYAIESITCRPKGLDSLGEVASGELVLRCMQVEASFVNMFNKPMAANFFMPGMKPGVQCLWATLEIAGHGCHIFHPDTSLDLARGTALGCIVLYDNHTKDGCFGLVVQKHQNDDGTHSLRRVGLIASLDRQIFDSCLPMVLSIR